MASKSIATGGLLVAVGVIVTIASDSGSATSLIPAFIGIVFIVLGVVARARPAIAHHAMHGAAAFAVLTILASLGSAIGRGSSGWALFSQLASVVIASGFLWFAVQSFRAARQERAVDPAST